MPLISLITPDEKNRNYNFAGIMPVFVQERTLGVTAPPDPPGCQWHWG